MSGWKGKPGNSLREGQSGGTIRHHTGRDSMGKQEKTNAMRRLDSLGLPYEALHYPSSGEALDAETVAGLLGVPAQTVFKTLVTQGNTGEYFVCVIPGDQELDLKLAAAAFLVKSLRMLHVDELKPVTGYVRGGCSPIGMKRPFRTAVDSACLGLGNILVSAGQIGAQIRLKPGDLLLACGGFTAALSREE